MTQIPTAYDPVNGPEPDSVTLGRPPVFTVLTQVAFAPVESVRDRAFVTPFQEAVRAAYPMFAEDAAASVRQGPTGTSVESTPVWRFHDAGSKWRLSLSTGFMALETLAYAGREDFLRRTGAALETLAARIGPTHFLRNGIRFVNRFPVKGHADVKALFRPEISGSAALALAEGRPWARSITNVSLPIAEGGFLTSFWGVMPPGHSHDPNILPPVTDAFTAFLDIDAATDLQGQPRPFDAAALAADTKRLAGRCHAFFRWALEDGAIEEMRRPSPLAGASFTPVMTGRAVH